MTTGPRGLELIKEFEELRLEPYLDPVGIPTIGWGHTKDVSMFMGAISVEKAEQYLKEDLADAEKGVNGFVDVGLNQNQFDALVSFTFNVGVGNLRVSTLLRKINSGDFLGASNEFKRWVFAKGRRLKGLERRRLMEAELWLS